MVKLYEIDEGIRQVENLLESQEETGIDAEYIKKHLDGLQLERHTKIDNIVDFTRENKGDIQTLEEEIKRLIARKKSLENTNEYLLNYLKESMQKNEETNIKTLKNTIYIRNNSSVNVINENLIPEDYKEYIETLKINKRDILKDLREGKEIDGVSLEISQSVGVR